MVEQKFEKCSKRKYKKPLLKKCEKYGIPCNPKMTIAELCKLLESHRPVKTAPRKERKKKQLFVSERLEAVDFDSIAKYIIECFQLS